MARQLWQLLLDDSKDLTCEECFAVMEYYAEVLASGGDRLLPKVLDHLNNCPECALQHSEALRRLSKTGTIEAGPPPSASADGAENEGNRVKTGEEGTWKNYSASS